MKTKSKKQTYGICPDWANIDLNSPSECRLNLLDSYNFDTLLLEVACNLPVVNEDTVRAQAMESIRSKYHTAVEILNDNLKNIVKHAKTFR